MTPTLSNLNPLFGDLALLLQLREGLPLWALLNGPKLLSAASHLMALPAATCTIRPECPLSHYTDYWWLCQKPLPSPLLCCLPLTGWKARNSLSQFSLQREGPCDSVLVTKM